MADVPSSRPKLDAVSVEQILRLKGVNTNQCNVLAIRGYYLNTMGEPGVNDRGIWDDAAFICSPTLFCSVNWNTDPSAYRKGRGTGAEKGMASLKEGVWDYKIGSHKGRSPAGNQAAPVTVIRDGHDGDYPETGMFAINLHWGGKGTSSNGCQTAPPNQWPSFIDPLVAELGRYDQKVFKYVLIDNAEMEFLLNDKPGQVIPKALDLAPALKIIKSSEGLRLKAYRDPVGMPTIGFGTTFYPDYHKVQMGDVCTKEQAEEWLMDHIREIAIPEIDAMCKVKLSNNEKCALISFAHNLGTGALKKSTLMRKLNEGKPREEVAAEFGKWVKAGGKVLKGLVKRRETERLLFLS